MTSPQKTNPIDRINEPNNQNDHRKHSKKKKEPVTATGDNRRGTGAGQRRQPTNRRQHSTNPSMEIRPATPEIVKPDSGQLIDYNARKDPTTDPMGQFSSNRRRGTGEQKQL